MPRDIKFQNLKFQNCKVSKETIDVVVLYFVTLSFKIDNLKMAKFQKGL